MDDKGVVIKENGKFIKDYTTGVILRLRSIFLTAIEIYQIKSVMATTFYMWRHRLITKEKVDNYCKGKDVWQNSVNDDLDLLFEDLQLGKEPKEDIRTYFLPKLPKEELKLVESKDIRYLRSFRCDKNPDVDEIEMQQSESDSKFINAFCRRRTLIIKNPFFISKNRKRRLSFTIANEMVDY